MKDKAAGLPGQGQGSTTPPFLVSAATAAALAPDSPDLTIENIKTELPRLLQEIVSPSSAARQEAVSARRRHVPSAGALSGPAHSLPECAPSGLGIQVVQVLCRSTADLERHRCRLHPFPHAAARPAPLCGALPAQPPVWLRRGQRPDCVHADLHVCVAQVRGGRGCSAYHTAAEACSTARLLRHTLAVLLPCPSPLHAPQLNFPAS